MTKRVREKYIALSESRRFYKIETRYTYDGMVAKVNETNNIEYAHLFDSLEEIQKFEKSDEEFEYRNLGAIDFFEGDFKPNSFMKIKVTTIYEELEHFNR